MDRKECRAKKLGLEPNRCFYSEKIGFDSIEGIDWVGKDVTTKRMQNHRMNSKKVLSDKYAPILHDIPAPMQRIHLQPALRWKKFSSRLAIAFPIQTIKPKVQLLYTALPGEIPREVEVERRLRRYSKNDLTKTLAKADIALWRLIPAHILHLNQKKSRIETQKLFNRFPLDWFDNYDFDCMLPDDWLNLGVLEGERHPIPGLAFLPNEANETYETTTAQLSNNLYKWVKVSVNSYDQIKLRWCVTDVETTLKYNIPRIYLMFMAEDPENFVNRIQYALRLRENSEKFLQYTSLTNCMETAGIPKLKDKMISKIYHYIRSTLKLPMNKFNENIASFGDETIIDYQRTLATIELKNNICLFPEKFQFISLPDEEPLTVKEPFVMEEIEEIDMSVRTYLKVKTLFCLPGVIMAMDEVVKECAHVSQMSFYTLSISKTASLEDFFSTEDYVTSNVLTLIKGYWIENLSGLICMHLRSIGKGWFDLRTRDWTIYKFSKMYNFIELIKYRMQNALRNLVENSIRMYINLLCRPCTCLLKVREDFNWGDDLITSPYYPGIPHVFYMILHIDENGPYYSTDPAKYEPLLIQLLQRPIHESHFVHLIDPLVMKSLIFADDLFLSSVGLTEAVVINARDLLLLSYRKALIPLNAYLRRFLQYMQFYLVNGKEYLRDFKVANHSPQEFQDEIAMHLRMKANLEITLPSSIQIGPFLVNVEPLKVFLVNKRQDMASKLLDMFIEKLKMETTLIINEYTELIRRLSEKPISIEVIFDTREWMETVPDTGFVHFLLNFKIFLSMVHFHRY